MTKQANCGPATTAILAGSIVCMFGACAPVRATLGAKTRVFVKVPGVLPPKAGQSRELPAKGDWHFRHVVDAASYDRDNKPTRAQWYQAWHTDKRDYLSWWGTICPTVRNGHVRKLTPEVCDAVKVQFGRYPDMVIPEQVFSTNSVVNLSPTEDDEMKKARRFAPRAGEAVPLTVSVGANPLWPVPGKDKGADCQTPLWYKAECYSQLDAARARVAAKYGKGKVPGVRIGILDTGFDRSHVAMPVNVEDELGGDGIGFFLQQDGVKRVEPGRTRAGHGTGTIGILAGRKVRFLDKKGAVLNEGDMGVVPNATIVPVRVAPFVVSLSTANMAYGIDYASREKQCDVISISNGGSPSPIWVDAINAAYNRGTVIVGAAGNYLSLPGIPLKTWSAPVFPAAHRRVIASTGVTASGGSYSRNDFGLLLTNVVQPWKWPSLLKVSSTFMKGSYGIDGSRDLLPAQLNPVFLGNLKEKGGPRNVLQRFGRSLIDWQQVRRVGELGASSISAYVPNTAWLVSSNEADGKRNDTVDLDGGGTSSTAPQVAGAAALWLQYHAKGLPRTSDRVQAVHTALALSAYRPWETPGAKLREDEASGYYKGAGSLKASDALDVSFAQAKNVKGKNLRNEIQPRDFYDGDRSMRRILFPRFNMALMDGDRLDQLYSGNTPAPRTEARSSTLERVFHNQELVEQWRRDISPVKCPTIWNWLTLPRITAPQTVVTERGIEARAKAKTKRAMTSAHSVQ